MSVIVETKSVKACISASVVRDNIETLGQSLMQWWNAEPTIQNFDAQDMSLLFWIHTHKKDSGGLNLKSYTLAFIQMPTAVCNKKLRASFY